MSSVTTDAKGAPCFLDSLVQGFKGFTRVAATARVTWISPWGWVVAVDPETGSQCVFYQDKFLVRGEPRKINQRGDIPERFKR